jgi:hypothetical protein
MSKLVKKNPSVIYDKYKLVSVVLEKGSIVIKYTYGAYIKPLGKGEAQNQKTHFLLFSLPRHFSFSFTTIQHLFLLLTLNHHHHLTFTNPHPNQHANGHSSSPLHLNLE